MKLLVFLCAPPGKLKGTLLKSIILYQGIMSEMGDVDNEGKRPF